MSVQETERRSLAAIMFTDIAGYSALAQRNEALALELLEEHRRLLRPIFAEHDGREIKTIGDAFMVEFTSPVQAMRCAVAMQQKLHDRNRTAAPERALRIRIGVHLGDVVHRDGDAYGDGVNIAARIEALAKPGGIYLSQQVYDQVYNKLGVPLVRLGQGKLKNIHVPVAVYRVSLPWQKAPVLWLEQLVFRMRQGRARSRVVAALVLCVAAGVGWFLLYGNVYRPVPEAEALFVQAKGLMSHSSSHLEDSRNNARVIQLLEEAVTLDPEFAEAHAKLGLAYVIRLFLFAPKEKALEQKAFLAVKRAFELEPHLAEAHEARGRLLWTAFNHFPHEKAIEEFRQALQLDPTLDEAHHYLGLVYLHVGLLEEGREEFEAAVKLNPSNNGAQYRIGESFFYEGKYRDALNVFDTIDPAFNQDLHTYQSAWAQFRLGEKEQALNRIEKSLRDYPGDKGGLLASVKAMMHAASGEAERAHTEIELARQGRGFGHFHHTQYNIACAYAMMNNAAKALEWLKRAVHEGFNCYPMFESDQSLTNLRNNPAFHDMLAEQKEEWERFRLRYSHEETARTN
jgi:class 3 adenylate cyclase/Tfp pilus assembly protein PilF